MTRYPAGVVGVGVAVVVTRDSGAEVLLVRRRGSHGAGTWSTPGGHVEIGESIEQCARREVAEETGIEISDPVFECVTNDVMTADERHYVTIWMRAEWHDGDATIAAQEEMDAIGWYRWDALPQPRFASLENYVAGRALGIR